MTEIKASEEIKTYFRNIEQGVNHCYEIANEIRKKGLDPEDHVNIPLAKNMAERVIGLISMLTPQFLEKKVSSKITNRIQELEKKYTLLDWRVALTIAEEVAKEKFCKFKDKLESMEVGIRVGFAYLTLGIVSAPLEGFIGLVIKKRKDGKEYMALKYAGPVRGAGGTGAAVSSLIGDYVRIKMGYAKYDPNEKEINRWNSEIHDYHDRVTNLQYHPSEAEIKFLAKHMPVEIDGDPTEKFEVSNYKDLPRIETNRIRGGFCLVLAEGLSQKAPKIWKRIQEWGKDFGLDWDFLGEFLEIQKKAKAAAGENKKTTSSEKEEKIKPNYTYIADLVAGRPVLAHPLAPGGFRLRYGRTRTSGFATAALHPATQYLLNDYIAIGTQLKIERPSKGASVSVCDSIEGPIVRLKDQSVLQITSGSQAKEINPELEKILFLGDILSDYGDFSEFGHMLIPAGYCPEWWIQELEKSVVDTFGNFDLEKLANLIDIDLERLKELFEKHLTIFPTVKEAIKLSHEMKIPLHPNYTYHWKLINQSDLLLLKEWLLQGSFKKEGDKFLKIILPFNNNTKKAKKVLEHIGFPHLVISKENVVIESQESTILAHCFNFTNQEDLRNLNLKSFPETNALEILNQISPVVLRDKSGTFIGARMGRPEKAKQRKMTGSPHAMFPIGEEGSRLRSFQAALKAGKVRSGFPFFYCSSCNKETIYSVCENCNQKTIQKYFCRFCGDLDEETCQHGPAQKYKHIDLDIKHYFNKALEKLQMKIFPDLIKGVRGTSNKDRLPEHLAKGILRAKHGIYVNKDGTTRYDSTEQPLTHFKPKEVHTSVEKLKELGYLQDIHGTELTHED
ncbi:DNA polymerase II large subunit, partial [Candidatus Woesearchaeota archaeon]|nr:DNA polymerase II large subunit [Candidatus Woesearchaeota archaeon]